jgi:hypothetical protein
MFSGIRQVRGAERFYTQVLGFEKKHDIPVVVVPVAA